MNLSNPMRQLAIGFICIALCNCGKGPSDLPGAVIAKLITSKGTILHGSQDLHPIIANARPAIHPIAKINFDHRVVVLDSPLRQLTIDGSVSNNGTGYSMNLHFAGPSIHLDQYVPPDYPFHAADTSIPDPLFVRIGTWEHAFDSPLTEVSVECADPSPMRDPFSIDSEDFSFSYFPNEYNIGRLRANALSNPKFDDEVIDTLVSAGFFLDQAKAGISRIRTEYQQMSDGEFSKQVFLSDGPSLSKEIDLDKALRSIYLQGAFDIESAFTIQINSHTCFVIRQVRSASSRRYSFRFYVSMINAKGDEDAWVCLLRSKDATNQDVADQLAILLSEDKQK